MQRRTNRAPCAVCNQELPSSKLSRVVVEGTTVLLCRGHATVVAQHMPRTFEELRSLFLEQTESGPARRSLLGRRAFDDRRVFPPRPEGRRMGGGRRSSDVAA
ncbi:MAG: hypothetical protein IPM79_18690 [Polyangiaceae bacterium]|nr:hypothetical protein [Polyangiaceae bacterium]MBK8939584.1 hypothetical protein [Polyangiaceae bacterium]